MSIATVHSHLPRRLQEARCLRLGYTHALQASSQIPAGESSVAEATGPEGKAKGARLAIAAAQKEWMQCEGVNVQA
eukprot:11312936-Alexandrium_andersonii.AAC.1